MIAWISQRWLGEEKGFWVTLEPLSTMNICPFLPCDMASFRSVVPPSNLTAVTLFRTGMQIACKCAIRLSVRCKTRQAGLPFLCRSRRFHSSLIDSVLCLSACGGEREREKTTGSLDKGKESFIVTNYCNPRGVEFWQAHHLASIIFGLKYLG